MSTRIVSLALPGSTRNQSLAVTTTRVYFAVSVAKQEVPIRFDVNSPDWAFYQSDGDYRHTNDLLNELQTARVADTTLLQFVQYDGISMWQFLPSYIWPYFYRAVELIRIIERIVAEINPSELRVFLASDDHVDLWYGAVQAVGEAHGIKVVPVREARGLIFRWRTILRWVLRRYAAPILFGRTAHSVVGSALRLATVVGRGAVVRDSSGMKLLFATVARHWVQDPTEMTCRYDEQFSPVILALRSGRWSDFVGIDCPYSSPWRVARSLWDRARDRRAGVVWRSFYSYALKARDGEDNEASAFRHQWRVLESDGTFAEDFRYRGVSLMPALRLELRRAFLQILPECQHMLAISRRILSEERPDAVCATYETGPFQRALIIEAGRAGIPTVGLVHGVVLGNHYDYMHQRISSDPILDPFSFIVPRVTCVWGPLWMRNLTEVGHYPPGAVVVTGNWRYDGLRDVVNHSPDRVGKALLRANSGEKLVIILSGGQSVVDYVSRCLDVMSEFPELRPLVRLHPSDSPQPVRELLHRRGCPPEMLVAGALTGSLAAAAIVLSQPSTTISEAALLDKPVVLVDFQKLQGWEAYHDAGICLYASDNTELSTAIREILEDDAVRARMAAARKRFVDDCFSSVDGRAAQRVAQVLDELLDEESVQATGSAREGRC